MTHGNISILWISHSTETLLPVRRKAFFESFSFIVTVKRSEPRQHLQTSSESKIASSSVSLAVLPYFYCVNSSPWCSLGVQIVAVFDTLKSWLNFTNSPSLAHHRGTAAGALNTPESINSTKYAVGLSFCPFHSQNSPRQSAIESKHGAKRRNAGITRDCH